MYFDPTLRTDAKPTETKADPFKLGTLIDWLAKQPADKRYCYLASGACALAQYFSEHGFQNVDMAWDGFLYDSGGAVKIHKLPPHFDKIASTVPHTYGAALDRARALSS